MGNLSEILQMLNLYQSRINDSTKSGKVDQEAHEKQANLWQDLVGLGVSIEKHIVYDVEEEKYKLTEEAKKLVGEAGPLITDVKTLFSEVFPINPVAPVVSPETKTTVVESPAEASTLTVPTPLPEEKPTPVASSETVSQTSSVEPASSENVSEKS